MSGIIWTYQKCPGCGGRFPSSKGGFPIICAACKTQPTKFQIKIPWQKQRITISRDRDGRTLHDFNHANNLLGQIRSEIQAGIFDPEIYKRQSATAFRAFWLKFQETYRHSPSTYAKVTAIGKHHLGSLLTYQMRDIRAYHIADWWQELQGKGLSAHYLNDILQWVKRFFGEAKDLDIIEKVPRFPRAKSLPKQDIQWYTEAEQVAVLSHLPEYDQPIFDFLFLTGVRVGEAIGLQRSDVDMVRGRTVIQHTIKRDGSLGPTKNRKPRVIPHVPEILDCYKRQAVKGLKYMFVNKWGRRYSDDYLRDTFRRACLDAGLEPIKLKNATRHSFGMGLIENGEDIWTVSKAMGHSDIRMTEHYVKVLAKRTRGLYGRRKCANGENEGVLTIGNKG
ncbi:MAG: tyrosine-type recombinase/integrase [Deltaproteobacteria bacterium]|nr:tyrosine-type recombinase/integrase [Deltaproteobacteria bacterium]